MNAPLRPYHPDKFLDDMEDEEVIAALLFNIASLLHNAGLTDEAKHMFSRTMASTIHDISRRLGVSSSNATDRARMLAITLLGDESKLM